MCPTPLEGLATNGIVHFDPNAYIRDGVSQYISEQDAYLPFDRPLYATPCPTMNYPQPPMVMHPQPHRDVYVRHEKRTSPWTAGIIGVVLGGLAAFLGYELFKGKEYHIDGGQVKEKAKGVWGSIKDFAGNAKDKVVSFFKGKKGESAVDKVVTAAAQGVNKVQNGFFKTKWRKTKIAAGIAASLGVVYLAYRLITGRNHKAAATSSSGGHE